MENILTLEDYFQGYPQSGKLFDRLEELTNQLGEVEVRVTKSQVGFWRTKAFAYAWVPEKYLRRKSAPLVLSVPLRRRDASPRWKQVVEPYPGRFTHHLELYRLDDLDGEVEKWLLEAWQEAG